MGNHDFARHSLAPLLLRLALAVIFIFHGMDKIVHHNWGVSWAAHVWERGRDAPPASVEFYIMQLAVAWGELLAGLALAAGILTRLAALGLMIIQAGAIYTVTFQRGFSFEKPFTAGGSGGGGWEYNFALLTMCLVLLVTGGGSLALGPYIPLFRRKKAPQKHPLPASA